ncbi:MAG: class I SAM-dependent methyltransferase [Bacteroidota bacterium]|jgi:SAM-dependent methyltransferase
MDQKEYWNKRFHDEGIIWTLNPCKSALIAKDKFIDLGINSILIPGAGYGRNAKLFMDSGFTVTGIEISERAIEIAKENNVNIKYFNGSILDMPFDSEKYDSIFCFNVLHLFLKEERKVVIDKFRNQLKEHGYGFIVVMSELEESFGKGEEIEPNTNESRIGKPIHYFTDSDLREHFKEFQIIESGIIEEPESHGGAHVHKCRYIMIKNSTGNQQSV